MIALGIVSLLCVAAIYAYAVTFLVRYRVVPPSLSLTAEYPHCYYWFQATICAIFGFLQFYYPVIYPFSEYGYAELLLNAGCAGLQLSGYFSYTPGEETKRDQAIHQYGSLSGGVLVMLFYAFVAGWWMYILPFMAACVGLGFAVKGRGWNRPVDNSVTFWVEMGIVLVMSVDLVYRFVLMLA